MTADKPTSWAELFALSLDTQYQRIIRDFMQNVTRSEGANIQGESCFIPVPGEVQNTTIDPHAFKPYEAGGALAIEYRLPHHHQPRAAEAMVLWLNRDFYDPTRSADNKAQEAYFQYATQQIHAFAKALSAHLGHPVHGHYLRRKSLDSADNPSPSAVILTLDACHAKGFKQLMDEVLRGRLLYTIEQQSDSEQGRIR